MIVKYRAWIKSLGVMADVLSIDFEDETVLLKGYKRDTLATFDQVILLGYIGLKDAEGVDIYEGDILKGEARAGEGGFKYLGKVVLYNQSNVHGYHLEDNKGGAWRIEQIGARISLNNVTGEVIGNIYENPDLRTTGPKGRSSGCK